MSWLKRRLPRTLWLRLTLLGVSLFFLLLAADMLFVQYQRRITFGADTTVLSAPLTPAGMPDYITALNEKYSKGVTPENNAAPLLLQVIGTDRMPPEWRTAVMPALGVPVETLPPKLVGPWEWLGQHPSPASATQPPLDADQELLMKHQPWTRDQHPRLAQWMNEQQEALAIARIATTRPRFFIPLLHPNVAPGLLPSYSPSDLFTTLSANALRLAGEGDIPAFHREILNLMKLARLQAQGPHIINFLIATAIEASACDAVGAVVSRSLLSAQQARDLFADIDALPPLPRPDIGFDQGTRFIILDELCSASIDGTQTLEIGWLWDKQIHQAFDPFKVPRPAVTPKMHLLSLVVPINFDQALRDVNTTQDRVVAAIRLPSYRSQYTALTSLESELAPYARLSSLFDTRRPGLALCSGASAANVIRLEHFTVARHSLARVALALSVYRQSHGNYPTTLDFLKGGLLTQIPLDPFIDAPLTYRPDPPPAKGYVLYSVGPEGHDHGGIGPRLPDGRIGDIVIRTP